jgi:4-amino-4-deoxy-L-arabinose transferase-like glycosyltransferase
MQSIDDETSTTPFFKGVALWALVLVVLHVGLALWYASSTPYRQAGKLFYYRHTPIPDIGAPDERQHANYVGHLLSGAGFPVFDPHSPTLSEDYQSHQPPAYYVLEAGWAKLTGVADVANQDSGLKLRGLNCLIGGATVFAVFCLGAWGFGRIDVGLCSAAVAACLPMNIALSGAMSNDPLLIFLSTASLAVCARAFHRGWSVRSSLALGIFVGLALLTKTTALALLPAVLVAVILSPQKPSAKVWAGALLPMILLPIGWWIRNQHLYGDPFAIKAFNDAFQASPQAKPFIEDLGLMGYFVSMVGWWTVRSFFGAFGYMDIWLNETGLPMAPTPNALYRLLMMFGFVLLVGWAMTWKEYRSRPVVATQIMNVVFGLIVALLFISFNLHYFQAQARYLYPALGPIACAFGAGALQLARGRLPMVLGLLLFVFGGTAVYAGTQLGPEFQQRISN